MKLLLTAVLLFSLLMTGCEKSGTPRAADDTPETVLAIAIDRGTATSESNAHRVLLSKNGEAASGWSRDPASMRRLDRLTGEKKTLALKAAAETARAVAPGEFALGSRDGDWLRVVIVTNKRRLVYDEAPSRGTPAPAPLRTVIDALADPADR